MDKTWKVVLAFVGIFAAGLVVGGMATLRILKQFAPARTSSAEQFEPQLMKRFVGKLDLTKEQEAKIKPIIARAAEELHQIRKTTWTTSQAVMDRASAEVGAVLTPEQKVKFEQIRAEQRERVKRAFGERLRRAKDERRPGEAPPQPPPPSP